MKAKKPIPELVASPFAPVELVDAENLSSDDRAMLEKEEAAIEAGSRTFLDVAAALVRIRDYKNGLVYKERYGTWEAYCTERWDFGRSYANRLTSAAEIVRLLPKGNKSGLTLPATERQVRPLARLPTPALRVQAWKAAIEEAGAGPVFGRHVEKAVRVIMKEKAIQPKSSRQIPPASFRLKADDLKHLQKDLARLRKLCADEPKAGPILALIEKIERRLPAV